MQLTGQRVNRGCVKKLFDVGEGACYLLPEFLDDLGARL